MSWRFHKCEDVGHKIKDESFSIFELHLVQDCRGHNILVCNKCRRNYPYYSLGCVENGG